MLIAATTTGEGGPGGAEEEAHTLLPMPSLFDLVAAEPDGDGAAPASDSGLDDEEDGRDDMGQDHVATETEAVSPMPPCRRELQPCVPPPPPLPSADAIASVISHEAPLVGDEWRADIAADAALSAFAAPVVARPSCDGPEHLPPSGGAAERAKQRRRQTVKPWDPCAQSPSMRGAPISLPPSVTSKAAQGLMKSDDTDDDSDDENYRSDPEQVTPLWCGSPPRWLSCIDPSLAAQHLSLREGACIDDLRGAEDSSDVAAFAMLVDACCAAADESVAQDPEKVAVPATDESRGEDEWQHLRSVKAQAAPPLTLPSSTLPSYAAFLAVMDDEKRADEEPNLINATPHESQQRVRLLTIFGWQKVAGSTNHKAHANWYLHLGDPSLEGMRNQKKVIRSIGANMQGDPRYDRAEAQKRAQAALPLLPRARSMQDVHSKSVKTAPVTPPATAGDWRRNLPSPQNSRDLANQANADAVRALTAQHVGALHKTASFDADTFLRECEQLGDMALCALLDCWLPGQSGHNNLEDLQTLVSSEGLNGAMGDSIAAPIDGDTNARKCAEMEEDDDEGWFSDDGGELDFADGVDTSVDRWKSAIASEQRDKAVLPPAESAILTASPSRGELSIGAEAMEGARGLTGARAGAPRLLNMGGVSVAGRLGPALYTPAPQATLPLHPHPDTPPAHEVVSGRFSSLASKATQPLAISQTASRLPSCSATPAPHAFTTAPPLQASVARPLKRKMADDANGVAGGGLRIAPPSPPSGAFTPSGVISTQVVGTSTAFAKWPRLEWPSVNAWPRVPSWPPKSGR